MDTNPKYIQMCSKAEEIQNHTSEDMDWYVCRTHHRILVPDGAYYSEYDCPDNSINGNIIWLPRQDQLQEMVACKFPSLRSLIEEFIEWENDSSHLVRQRDRFNSMEQLWLAFVMHEKYGKIWDSQKEKWVKEG